MNESLLELSFRVVEIRYFYDSLEDDVIKGVEIRGVAIFIVNRILSELFFSLIVISGDLEGYNFFDLIIVLVENDFFF